MEFGFNIKSYSNRSQHGWDWRQLTSDVTYCKVNKGDILIYVKGVDTYEFKVEALWMQQGPGIETEEKEIDSADLLSHVRIGFRERIALSKDLERGGAVYRVNKQVSEDERQWLIEAEQNRAEADRAMKEGQIAHAKELYDQAYQKYGFSWAFEGVEKAKSHQIFSMEVEKCDTWKIPLSGQYCVTVEGLIKSGTVQKGDSILFDIAGLTCELPAGIVRVLEEKKYEFKIVSSAAKGQRVCIIFETEMTDFMPYMLTMREKFILYGNSSINNDHDKICHKMNRMICDSVTSIQTTSKIFEWLEDAKADLDRKKLVSWLKKNDSSSYDYVEAVEKQILHRYVKGISFLLTREENIRRASMLMRAENMLKEEKMEDALVLAQKALKMDPEDGMAWCIYILAKNKKRDFEEFVKWCMDNDFCCGIDKDFLNALKFSIGTDRMILETIVSVAKCHYKYEEGLKKMKAKEYRQAAEIFAGMEGYKDSKKLLKKCENSLKAQEERAIKQQEFEEIQKNSEKYMRKRMREKYPEEYWTYVSMWQDIKWERNRKYRVFSAICGIVITLIGIMCLLIAGDFPGTDIIVQRFAFLTRGYEIIKMILVFFVCGIGALMMIFEDIFDSVCDFTDFIDFTKEGFKYAFGAAFWCFLICLIPGALKWMKMIGCIGAFVLVLMAIWTGWDIATGKEWRGKMSAIKEYEDRVISNCCRKIEQEVTETYARYGVCSITQSWYYFVDSPLAIETALPEEVNR